MISKQRISAEIVADSINIFGDRITTMILTMPRFVLAELNTHRMLSKNSASSRAIPFLKMANLIDLDPFIPIAWQNDHPGMQGNTYIKTNAHINYKRALWLDASKKAVTSAKEIHANIVRKSKGSMQDVESAKEIPNTSVTKQLCNRILEPFMWHKVLVTGTEWANFVGLRAHGDAEIHINALAEEVITALNASTPVKLQPGQWHLPFGDTFEFSDLRKSALKLNMTMAELKIAVAIARCARVSYNNFNGSAHDYIKDYELFKKLFISQPIHASPSEHVAYSMSYLEYISNVRGELSCDLSEDGKNIIFNIEENKENLGWCRNFKGWVQYRTLLENDTILTDTRLK